MLSKKLNVVLLSLLLLAAGLAVGQQDPMYTQHMFNRLAINPAYAGSRDLVSMTSLYRHQWEGIDGAPRTATFAIHSPLRNNRVALGLLLVNDRLGLINQTGAYGSYAYRIPMGNGKFSMGIQGGISNYRIGLSQSSPHEGSDPLLMSDENLWLPNFGFGVYYYAEKWFAGAAIPKLVNNRLGTQGYAASAGLPSQEQRHLFAMGGYVFDLSSNLKFRPSVLYKYVQDSPMELDFNGSFLIADVLWLGAAYRTNASVDFNMEVNLTRFMRLGYAYDYVLKDLGDHTSGSHEILLGFDFNFARDRVLTPRNINPRYF